MFKLIVIDAAGKKLTIDLEDEPKTLGRGTDCDVLLRSRSIPRHLMNAWIEDETRVMVEDLTGGQGLSLEGERISGTFELEPGAQLESGPYAFTVSGEDARDTALEAKGSTRRDLPAITQPKAEPMSETPRPALYGIRGRSRDQRFVLADGANDIGRSSANQVVLDDGSISRLHAKLTVDGDQYILRDMRSSNGTFLNKKRLEEDEVELKDGALVRFGNLEYAFSLGPFDLSAYLRRKKRKMMMLGGLATAAALIAVVVVLIGIMRPPPPKPKPPTGPATGPATPATPTEIEVEKRIVQATKNMRQRDWAGAKQSLAEAIEIDPLCKKCRTLDAKIDEEIANQKRLHDGRVEYELSHWAETRKLLTAIPTHSVYFRDAKEMIAESEKKLSSFYKIQFEAADRRKDYAKAHAMAIDYMKLNPCDRTIYDRWVVKFEKQMRARRIQFTPHLFDCEVEIRGPMDPEEALHLMYPKDELYEVALGYYKGKLDRAIEDTKKLAVDSKDKQVRALAKQLLRGLTIIRNNYNQGSSDLMRGDETKGRTALRTALQHDSKIMPTGLVSFYRNEIGNQLGAKLYKQGFSVFTKGDYFAAFSAWNECLKIKPDHEECNAGMKKLEKVGDDVLEMARKEIGRGNAEKAFAILQDLKRIVRPTSLQHKQAELLLEKVER
ncbi:MAG: FHA domain-containing protein [Deltaproteobacteria bacterium]|nr:FHA domain-containing protein [Deltaproteobacteria bacterium]